MTKNGVNLQILGDFQKIAKILGCIIVVFSAKQGYFEAAGVGPLANFGYHCCIYLVGGRRSLTTVSPPPRPLGYLQEPLPMENFSFHQ